MLISLRYLLTIGVLVLSTAGLGCEAESEHPPSVEAANGPATVDYVDTAAASVREETPAVPADTIADSRRTAVTRAVETASPAVVSIGVERIERVRDPFFDDPFFRHFMQRPPRERQTRGTGSGFVMSPDGYIVTNEHVVSNARSIEVYFPDGSTYSAEVVGEDRLTDLALLKIEPDDTLPHLSFDTTEAPIPGEWVIALGNPFGLFEASEPSVTVGVVSATDRTLQSGRDGRMYRNMIQTDAAINRGNSGGPLLNAIGEVIGVNTAIYSDSGGSVGIGFAVPAERAVEILEQLQAEGEVARPHYTGLDLVRVDSRIARALSLRDVRGMIVRDVEPGSPADRAGLQTYDVVLEIEGTRIDNRDDYLARVFDFRPGDELTFTIERNGDRFTVPITLGRRE